MESVIDLTSDSESSVSLVHNPSLPSNSATNKKRKLDSDGLPKNKSDGLPKTHSDGLPEPCSDSLSDSLSKKQKSGKTFYFINVDNMDENSVFARNVPHHLENLFRAAHSKSDADYLVYGVATLGQTAPKAELCAEAKASESNPLTVGELVEALGFNVADYFKTGDEWDEYEKEIMENFLTKLETYFATSPTEAVFNIREGLRGMETGTADCDDLLKSDMDSVFVFYQA
jgi:hypothetical protein